MLCPNSTKIFESQMSPRSRQKLLDCEKNFYALKALWWQMKNPYWIDSLHGPTWRIDPPLVEDRVDAVVEELGDDLGRAFQGHRRLGQLRRGRRGGGHRHLLGDFSQIWGQEWNERRRFRFESRLFTLDWDGLEHCQILRTQESELLVYTSIRRFDMKESIRNN